MISNSRATSTNTWPGKRESGGAGDLPAPRGDFTKWADEIPADRRPRLVAAFDQVEKVELYGAGDVPNGQVVMFGLPIARVLSYRIRMGGMVLPAVMYLDSTGRIAAVDGQ